MNGKEINEMVGEIIHGDDDPLVVDANTAHDEKLEVYSRNQKIKDIFSEESIFEDGSRRKQTKQHTNTKGDIMTTIISGNGKTRKIEVDGISYTIPEDQCESKENKKEKQEAQQAQSQAQPMQQAYPFVSGVPYPYNFYGYNGPMNNMRNFDNEKTSKEVFDNGQMYLRDIEGRPCIVDRETFIEAATTIRGFYKKYLQVEKDSCFESRRYYNFYDEEVFVIHLDYTHLRDHNIKTMVSKISSDKRRDPRRFRHISEHSRIETPEEYFCVATFRDRKKENSPIAVEAYLFDEDGVIHIEESRMLIVRAENDVEKILNKFASIEDIENHFCGYSETFLQGMNKVVFKLTESEYNYHIMDNRSLCDGKRSQIPVRETRLDEIHFDRVTDIRKEEEKNNNDYDVFCLAFTRSGIVKASANMERKQKSGYRETLSNFNQLSRVDRVDKDQRNRYSNAILNITIFAIRKPEGLDRSKHLNSDGTMKTKYLPKEFCGQKIVAGDEWCDFYRRQMNKYNCNNINEYVEKVRNIRIRNNDLQVRNIKRKHNFFEKLIDGFIKITSRLIDSFIGFFA